MVTYLEVPEREPVEVHLVRTDNAHTLVTQVLVELATVY